MEAAGGGPAFSAAGPKLQGCCGAWCLCLRLGFLCSGALLSSFVVPRNGQQLYPTRFQLHALRGVLPLPLLLPRSGSSTSHSYEMKPPWPCWALLGPHPASSHPGCRDGPYAYKTSSEAQERAGNRADLCKQLEASAQLWCVVTDVPWAKVKHVAQTGMPALPVEREVREPV